MTRRRLSLVAPHSYIELSRSEGGIYIGAGPLPVFALVRISRESAIQIRAMLDDYLNTKEPA